MLISFRATILTSHSTHSGVPLKECRIGMPAFRRHLCSSGLAVATVLHPVEGTFTCSCPNVAVTNGQGNSPADTMRSKLVAEGDACLSYSADTLTAPPSQRPPRLQTAPRYSRHSTLHSATPSYQGKPRAQAGRERGRTSSIRCVT